jgi:hypothetical protein
VGAEKGSLTYWIGRVGLLLLLAVVVGGIAVTTFRALVGLVQMMRGDGDTNA